MIIKHFLTTIFILLHITSYAERILIYDEEKHSIHTTQISTHKTQQKVDSSLKDLNNIEAEISSLTEKLTENLVIYPNCHSFIMTHHFNANPPPGFQEHHTQDLMWTKKNNYDDFKLFISLDKIIPGKQDKCYVNHLVSGREPYGEKARRGFFGSETFPVPKGTRAHLISSPHYFCGTKLFISVTEEYSNKIIYTDLAISPNTEISLPYSNDKNQLFLIKIKKTWNNTYDDKYLCDSYVHDDARGAILYHIDHINADLEKQKQIQDQINQLREKHQQLSEELEFGNLETDEI